MERNSSSSSRLQRCINEKDRRTLMRHHLSRLASVLRPQPPKLTVPSLIDETVRQVKEMHERIEELKLRKAQAEQNSCMDDQVAADNSRLLRPVLDIIISGDDLQLNLISGLNEKFVAHDVIRVLQEEGAEVTSFSSHKVGDRIIYTIKSKPIYPRIGIETLRVHERLKGLMNRSKIEPTVWRQKEL